MPYVTKTLQKTIVRRSNLQTKYFKTRAPESLKKYRKQKNYCSRLYTKERKALLTLLTIKHFGKIFNPLFLKIVRLLTKLHLRGIMKI